MLYLLAIFSLHSNHCRPSSSPPLEQHSSINQANPEIEENISFSDDVVMPDAQHISDEDQLPSDLQDIIMDDGVITIPLEEVDEDYFTSSGSDLDYQDNSDTESDTSEQDSGSDITVEYDDEGEIPTQLGATTHNQPPVDNPQLSSIGRQNIENHLRQKIISQKFTDSYPTSNAGVPITTTAPNTTPPSLQPPNSNNNPYFPFPDRMNWEIARWAKLRGPGSTAISELLSIDNVCHKFLCFFLRLKILIYI